jgi:hypothetical protein
MPLDDAVPFRGTICSVLGMRKGVDGVAPLREDDVGTLSDLKIRWSCISGMFKEPFWTERSAGYVSPRRAHCPTSAIRNFTLLLTYATQGGLRVVQGLP